jgi:hypothetical protein
MSRPVSPIYEMWKLWWLPASVDAMTTATDVPASTWERVSASLERLAKLIDRRPALALPVWIAAYFAVLWAPAHRPLWYDELFTYYTAMSPSWDRFAGSILHVDLNPPLSYFFVRSGIVLFGDSAFVTRLPSLLGFLAATLIVFELVRRRLGGGFGLAALGILWSFSLTAYAVEARPYGLLLAFFSLATLCWLNAAEKDSWTKWHTGLAAAISAMFLMHCFSPVFAAAIGCGEMVRAMVLKRIDRRVWAALLAPLSILPLYLPLVRNATALLTPTAFDATAMSVPRFYLGILYPIVPAMGLLLLFWLVGRVKGPRVHWWDFAALHELAFSIAAFLAPLVLIGYCIWSGVPFWQRYGVGAALGGSLMLTAFLAVITRRNSGAAVASAGLILILFCVTKAGTGRLMKQYENPSTNYRTTHPELPFVTASGLTFLEMDHREAPEFTTRLYYLTDREAAVRNHSTIFEGLPQLRQWFPVRSKIEPYRDFIRRSPRFLVLATPEFPEDWLLPKLQADGAQIRLLQELKTGYRDHHLYEVTLHP